MEEWQRNTASAEHEDEQEQKCLLDGGESISVIVIRRANTPTEEKCVKKQVEVVWWKVGLQIGRFHIIVGRAGNVEVLICMAQRSDDLRRCLSIMYRLSKAHHRPNVLYGQRCLQEEALRKRNFDIDHETVLTCTCTHIERSRSSRVVTLHTGSKRLPSPPWMTSRMPDLSPVTVWGLTADLMRARHFARQELRRVGPTR